MAKQRQLHGLQRLAQQGIRLRVSGRCMNPEIRDGEWLEVGGRRLYWPGDILVYQGADGNLFAHRLLGWFFRQGEWRILTRADNADHCDGGVPLSRVIGRVRAMPPSLPVRLKCLGHFLHQLAAKSAVRLRCQT